MNIARALFAAALLLVITAAPALAGTPAPGGAATPIVVPCVCGGVGRKSPILTTWGGPGNDTAEGVAVAGDGSLYLAGTTDSFGAGRTDVLLLKLTPGRGFVWARTWGGDSTDTATAVGTSPDGSVYVTGTTSSFGPGNPAFLLKFSSSGLLLWQRTWGGMIVEFAHGLAVASDGGVVIVGQTASFDFGTVRGAFVVRFSATGDMLWERYWGGPVGTPARTTFDGASGVAIGPDGSVYVAGQTESFSSVYEVFLLKFTADGTFVYARLWSRTLGQFATGIAVSGDGSVYVTEIWFGGSEFSLLKFTAAGNLTWQRRFNEIGTDTASGLVVLPDGSVVVAGWTDSFGAGLQDELLVRFTALGDLVSVETWGGASSEAAHGIAATGGGGVAVAGLTWSAGPYRLAAQSTTLTDPGGSVRTPTGNLQVPPGIVTIPGGSTAIPIGSTTFAGYSDATVFGAAP